MSLRVVASSKVAAAIEPVIEELVSSKVASRLAAKDYTLWGKAAEAESSIRLGWISSAFDSQNLVGPILELREELQRDGVNRVVLCGMGGSSLAPEVITGTSHVELVVLDSTDPDQVNSALSGDLARTVVVVSSKSGSTVETDSQKRVFERAFAEAGIPASERIIVVTDPGSPMEAAAKADGYRVFNADPTVGGRYSALTAFGLVPSGLAGVDIAQLLSEAQGVSELLALDSASNPALVLGAAMARTPNGPGFADKLGILVDGSPLVGFGDWAEQLIAESTGKDDKGVLPVVLDASSPEIANQPADLLLARIVAEASASEGVEVQISGALGAQFLLWEFATAVASQILQLNPFDQPDVESAKIAARAMLSQGASGASAAPLVDAGIEVRSQGVSLAGVATVEAAVQRLLEQLDPKSGYVSVMAYLDRTSLPEASALRNLIAEHTGRPVTFGWGPRFLHSTGQYHKGGPKQGVYLQITSGKEADLSIPGREFTFGELIESQAAGDAKVLADLGRPVLTLTFAKPAEDLARIAAAL